MTNPESQSMIRVLASGFFNNAIVIQVNCALLPRHHLIDDILLLRAGFSQIDPGGFDTFMSHQVRQHRNIIIPFQEAFAKRCRKE